MGKLVTLENNYLVITDTVSSDVVFEAPLKDVTISCLPFAISTVSETL